MMNNKIILITGGTGSLGKRLVKYISKFYKPKLLIIYSRDEQKQHSMATHKDFSNTKIKYILGDVRDYKRFCESSIDVDIIVHTAALKHVHFGENNPLEFIKTNINGTENIIKASILNKIDKVLFVSTDKSVYPINLYGATKLIAEKLILDKNLKNHKTKFSVVRYGNVAGSKGSIIPKFLTAIKNNEKYLYVRDKNITRFWITFNDAINSIIVSLELMKGGEVFIPKMKSFNILNLAEALVSKNKIKITSLDPGEKLHENLTTKEDSKLIIDVNNFYIIYNDINSFKYKKTKDKSFKMLSKSFCYSSDINNSFLSVSDLKKLLKNIEVEF